MKSVTKPTLQPSPISFDDATTSCHPIANLITKAINENIDFNSTSSSPIVQVRDVSVWYKNRSVIGPKRHATRLIKKQCDSTPTGNVKYTSAIYDIDLKGEIVKRSLGTYSTYAKASKVCDRACMLRDYPSSVAQNPPNSSKRRQSNQHNFRRNLSSKNGRDGVVGPTHLNVVVVSERFCGISHRDRVQSVYNAILPAFCTNMENSERIMFGSRRMNKYGTVGKHVLSLQLFMHLRSNLCSHLLLDLRAPSQHSFHLESKVPNTDNGAGSLDQFIHQLIQPSILREIVNHSTSTTAPREENSHPFGHFFHDMKKEAKQLVMSEYKTNLNMINGDKRVLEKNSYLRKVIRAGHVKVVANEVLSVDKRSSKSGVGNKSFFARLGDTSIWQVSSAQSNVSDEILMQYDLLMNRITHHVLRIQRLYRFHYFHRTQRKWYNRHRAALMLQRVWKGSRGRSSVKLFRKQLALAPGVIQSLWRGYQGRREASQLRAALTKAASKMQPIVRGMIARKYFDWLVSNKAFATAIQRIARGYISRCKVKQLQFVKLAMLHDASAVMIQMCARIWMSKLVFSKRKWHVFVVVPSVIMIQSYWRKHTSRTISGAKQRTRNAIIRMQAWIRGFLHRGRIRSFVEKRSRRLSAIKIQSHARRWISQEFSERAMARRYHKFVVVPSAVMIQTRYRCYFYENALFKRKSRWKSTISIQSEFRRWTSTRLLGRLRQQERCRFLNQVSTKIQANYRGYRARYMFESLKTNAISRRVYASRVILRAWIRYKSMLQHHAWKDMWILSRGKAALMSIGKEKQDTIFDLEQVSRDIASRRKIIGVADLKLKETKAFITQAYARRELVQVELESLETDAKSDDLSELLDNEIFVLSNKISMARQHLQHSKIQLGRAKEEVYALRMERNDIHMSLDEIFVLEIEEHERLRRFEVQKEAKTKEEDIRRRVRHEVNKWKAKDICKKIGYKECDAIANSKQSEVNERSLKLLSTMSFVEEQALLSEEIYTKQRFLLEGSQNAYETLRRQNFEEKTIMRGTFDNIVDATAVILKNGWKKNRT